MNRKRSPSNKDSRWRWSNLWSNVWADRPFYSVSEQKVFDLEMARLRAQTNVALTVSKVAYGLR